MDWKILRRQAEKEPYEPKRKILLASPLETIEQAYGLNLLMQPHSYVYYDKATKKQLSFPEDNGRHYGVPSDWYFLVGQLQDIQDSRNKFAFVLVLQGYTLVGPALLHQGETPKGVSIEEAFMTTTIYTPTTQKTVFSQDVLKRATDTTFQTTPFLAKFSENFILKGSETGPFPMQMLARDTVNNHTIRLKLTGDRNPLSR